MPIKFTVTASPNDKIVTIADPVITIEDVIPPVVIPSVNNTLQNLTEGEATLNYYIGAMTYKAGNKIAIVIRRGLVHGYDGSSEMVRFITEDGANTWVRDVMFSESGFDVRNYGGGTTSAGVILIFYARLGASGWISQRVMRSVDGGQTFTHSGDLIQWPDMEGFSPHGRLVELGNGDLLQTFYGGDPTGTTYIYTLKSTDEGLTWGNLVLVAEGIKIFEPSIVYLGNNKLICAIRKDVTDVERDMLIYNSSDGGTTWVYIGKAICLGFDLPGTSPLLLKLDENNATIIATARVAYNNFNEVTLSFGSAVTTGLKRTFYEGRQRISSTNIDFGYPAFFSLSENEQDKIIAFNDSCERWVSGPPATDLMVSPLFRRVETITQRTSGTITSGGAFSPAVYVVDELSCYNVPVNPTYQHKIRTAGDYSIRVQATFTGSGSSRNLNVLRYTSGGVLSWTMFIESGSGNSYDFTTTQTIALNEAIALQVIHDASPLTVSYLRMTITKL